MIGEMLGLLGLPAPRRLEGKQRYRVYYNRSEDAPQVWSIDTGSVGSEVNVQWVQLHTSGITRYDAEAKFPEPRAWLDVFGRLRIVAGGAVLE